MSLDVVTRGANVSVFANYSRGGAFVYIAYLCGTGTRGNVASKYFRVVIGGNVTHGCDGGKSRSVLQYSLSSREDEPKNKLAAWLDARTDECEQGYPDPCRETVA